MAIRFVAATQFKMDDAPAPLPIGGSGVVLRWEVDFAFSENPLRNMAIGWNRILRKISRVETVSAIDADRSFRSACRTPAIDGPQGEGISTDLTPYWEEEGNPRWAAAYPSRRGESEAVAQLLSGSETRQYNDDDPPGVGGRGRFSGD